MAIQLQARGDGSQGGGDGSDGGAGGQQPEWMQSEEYKSALTAGIAEATKGLKANRDSIFGQMNTMKEQLAKFGNADPDVVKDLLSRFESEEEKQLFQQGNLDKIVDNRVEKMRAKFGQEMQEKDSALSKSADGIKLDLTGIKGSTIKIGTAITGGVDVGADQTIVAGMQALSNSIQTAVSGGITSLTSPDETLTISGSGTSRSLVVNVAKIVSANSAIQVGTDGKLDIF